MYKEVSISSNNVPITLSIWYTERGSHTIVFCRVLCRTLSCMRIFYVDWVQEDLI